MNCQPIIRRYTTLAYVLAASLHIHHMPTPMGASFQVMTIKEEAYGPTYGAYASRGLLCATRVAVTISPCHGAG
jgi:hypothetical protein